MGLGDQAIELLLARPRESATRIEIETEDLGTPESNGESDDIRVLGIQVTRVEFSAAYEPDALGTHRLIEAGRTVAASLFSRGQLDAEGRYVLGGELAERINAASLEQKGFSQVRLGDGEGRAR